MRHHTAVQNGLSGGDTGNSFLDSLPRETSEKIWPLLSKIDLTPGLPIARTGERVDRIVFPVRSVISSVTRMRDGSDIEITLIGRDGFHGLQAILGDGASSTEAMVQLADTAYAVPAQAFVDLAKSDDELMRRVLRFAQASIETISQFSGCNRVHMVEERCARWLLMVADRIRSEELSVTHDFLATMLGVRRPSVTLAVGSLERAGMIESRRARIAISDRAKLEEIACECYEQSIAIVKRLMGYTPRA